MDVNRKIVMNMMIYYVVKCWISLLVIHQYFNLAHNINILTSKTNRNNLNNSITQMVYNLKHFLPSTAQSCLIGWNLSALIYSHDYVKAQFQLMGYFELSTVSYVLFHLNVNLFSTLILLFDTHNQILNRKNQLALSSL